ncbi:mechanosensitive ion channel family protein [Herbiconiux daphne]|uniref:Mechanosensitive ion channel family protein n=1 Tax=Herbiconiux daphne TaxID=2970914 RepID=A0ABT2H4V8_9MICO|nr:mechanosensitive ion channel family protein [Herbiconiux daphne]MCS5734956.1 mechanosensitive ion channel family protein [Herbiconiux daphne]
MPVEKTWLAFAIAAVLALLIAIAVTAIVTLIIRLAARRQQWPKALVRRARIPFRVFLVVLLLWLATTLTMPEGDWQPLVDQAFMIVAIATGAWLVCALALFFEDVALARYTIDRPDNRIARRLRTQVLILRRLAMAVVIVVALGAILLTFPGAQAVGTSVLASAGVVSIIAGLAAQSTLSNVFAGMQIAFSDAVRVDDVVIVENEWGRIEEITLTYVVVHIWDDRRMVVPSTYFTSKPFQNWTRRNSELLGSVEFDLDWRVTPGEMRAELERVLARTDLWDKRVSVLQVTDAVGGYVRVRILVTAIDAPTLFDLRCFIREEMIAWLYRSSPQSIPRTRVRVIDEEPDVSHRARRGDPEASGLFHGDSGAEGRASLFTGPIETTDRAAGGFDAPRAPRETDRDR